MNEYIVSSIKDGNAVLFDNGLTVNVPLANLPDNLRAGDILILNAQGGYERRKQKKDSVNEEQASDRNELFQGDTFDIKQDVDYNSLLDEVRKTFFRSTESELKHFVPELLLFVLSLLCVLTITLVDRQRFSDSIIHHDIASYLGTLCIVIITSVGAIGLILSFITIFRTIRKMRRYVVIYKSNLRKMQEKLTLNNIFVKISPEDEHRYDNVFKQISETLKNREKKT